MQPKKKCAGENSAVALKQCKVLLKCHKQFGLFDKLSIVPNEAKIWVFIRERLKWYSSTHPAKSRIVGFKRDWSPKISKLF